MAAPQQHPLTNTSCTFSSSPAAFPPTAGSYGSGKTAFCGDLQGQVSVASDRNVQSLVCSSTTVSPQPILTNSASRKTKPCSLCGTAALRSQSSLVPNSPVSPQEQPVVLLHRLEDGLPEGDVDSLRAFGTIRLLPVHCGKVEGVTDDSKHECDRKYQSVTSHTMAPGNLAYKSFKRGNIKKRTELPSVSQGYGDLKKSLTSDILRKFKASDDHHNFSEKLSEQKVKNNTNSNSGGTSHRTKKNSEARVNENSVGYRLVSGEETLGERLETLSSQQNHLQYSTVSSVSSASQSPHRVSSPQYQTLSPHTESLDCSATSRSSLSSQSNLPSPQTSTSSAVNNHSHDSTSQAHSTHDTIHQRSASPDTPMSAVCSPVLPLTTAALSSPSQNIDSPSTISPPESPPSPPSPFSPAFMGSPSTCDRENLHSSCSVDVQQSSSPYSPCTLPSLPASPTSLPSSSKSPPSPALSIDSPPISPAACEISDSQVPFSETLGGDSRAEETDSAARLDTVFKSKADPEVIETRDSKAVPQYHLTRTSSMENDEVSNKSHSGQKEVAQVPSASETGPAPSAQIHMPEDTSTASQNSEIEAHADTYQESSTDHECGDRENSLKEVEHLKPDFVKSSLNSESKNVEAEKNCSDSKNSLMKLVLKVKHPANQQLPVGPEKKDYNKENGIPKIVLTLRGNGPNKEYSCSNRLRNESESCSGESVNNKKHKSKRNKRQKPKDREKVKKVMKVGKHKRHVELFGEDSNDSCDIIPDNIKNHTSEGRHSRTPSTDEQILRPSFTPHATEEAPSVPDERNLAPTLSPGESPSHCAKYEESAETADSPSPTEQSLSHSLPSDASEVNTDVGDRTKSLIKDSEEITETQTECTESNTHETSNLTVEVPKTRDDEPAFMELQQEGKETSQASSGTLHSSEIDHQNKQPEGLILRSRRSRHAKNTESGRNSDTCLWVSFGVNAPMPLPATDLPSLEPLFTSKEKTKLKESETNGSKEHASSNQPKVEVKKHPPKATHKERKEREKTETQPDATKESTEHEYESKAKFLTEHSDSKTVVSHGHRKVHSSSSHEDSNGAHCKVRSHGDSTHHRSRHSHKRQRKSDDDREGAIMKETDSRQHSSLDATERDDSRSEEKSTESCKEKLATSDFTPVCGFDDVQMKTEEKSAAEESCTLPNTSSRVDGSKEGHKESPNNISHEENEVNVKPEKPTNLKPEETSDDQYYRPKKIRKAFNSKITSDHHNEITSTDQKTTKAHSDEKTVSNQPEDCKDQVSPKFSSPEVVTISSLSGMHAVESESFRVECHTSEVKTDVPWRPHEEIIRRDMLLRSPQNSETSNDQRKRKHRSPTPLGQDLVTKLGVESADEQSKQAAEGKKEEAADKLADIKKDSFPGNEDNEKKEVSKKEKEKRKKPRKEKRKDGSRPGSRCAVLQEAQFRREVEHEEGRGRRLAQEIKGFNWLEQKIKNSSLLSSRTVPSTPTSSSSGKELESPSKSVSSTPTTSSSHFTFGNKEEEHARKNSFSGSSSSIGFKRHLQTAVPPLIPSSKVTALPKRRPSLGTPITPPCSAPPTLCSATSVPSMIVQGALYTCEPTPYRSGHGRVPPPLEKSSTSLEHAEADKATLYSSTSSTKATLYGVKDNSLEALYDTVSVNAVNYYDSVTSGNIDTQYNITTSPPICFYGSAKYQEPGLHPDKTPATGPHAKSSVISTSQDSGGMTDHQVDKLHSPKPDTCSSRNSDWSAWQGSSPNSQHSGYSADPHSPQRFSHKQALLRRAFQEMMKSDSNNSSTEQTKEKESVIQSTPTKTEINMADESKSKEMETPGSTTGQSSSESTSSVDIKSLKSQCPDNTPPLLLNKCFSESTERHIFSYSPRSIAASLNSEKDVIDPVCTENIISTSANKQEGAENVGCKVDSNKKIVVAESSPNITENDSDKETSLEKINDDKNVKVPKDLQSDVIDCIRSESGDIDMKVLKEEICYKGDGKSEEDAEVQPRLLLSVLYKELMKTRQEVEKLRKVQELMLTEKEEKKEDAGEQNSETKVESETVDENSHNNERNLEKRKDHESSDVKLKIDDEEECYYHESKKSKISIRSDLLPREDSVGLDTTSSNTSASQKIISLSHQSSSPTLTNPAQVQSNLEISMTSLKGSAVPDTSHASRVSPAIPAVSPGLSSSILVSPNLTTSQPRGHPRASPGVSSPGIPRTSPGIPRPSPPITRASPGIPKSNSGSIIVSPGASVSPAIPSSSPGITSSPGVPRSSPGVLRMSPGLPRIHSGISRISPGAPLVSPGPLVVSPAAPVISPGIPMVSPSSSRNGLGLIRNDSEVTVINPGTTQMSPSSSQGNMFNTPTNPSSAEDLHISYSNPAVTTAQPKITTVQSVISPVVPVPRFPQIPLTSTAVPIISPTGGKTNSPVPRISPSTSKIDPVATVPLKKTSLTNMSPTKLRSVFGISNSEVELMPVSVGPKQSLHEPQPRTFLNLIEDQHHQTTEMPLLLNAVQGVHQESGSKNVESSSHGAVPFHSLAGHEDLKRISKAHQYPGEIKRHALSTSDLPDHASSACKQPPPLKPATTLVRRHSDNMDIHSAMHHHPLYSGTRKNLAGSLHSSAAPTELKNPNTAHSFNQPQYSPTQYPLTNPRGRRNTDANSTERNRGYQQTVPMGMQHQFAHLPPGSSVMRSLGPDKATIFPIPPTMPASIRPFRPSVLPPATRTHLEQLQNENFYRTNFSFFEKIREKFAQPCDNGVSAMDRLQASTANVEKPMQPQTFAPRVLVRESIPEAHTPTTSYTMHFSNQNQPPHNVMPSHQNHFSTNMHSGPSLQHLTQARLHSQATSSMQRANSSSVRSGEKLCFHCPQQARFICSGCKKAWYCSEQCQREHWSIHSSACVL
ncbi:mucin-4-like [Scylla paramamosain]|uniref:mucin-4-like n=1 Tax=Scylla paramamosain TaxID=85552 RepID=UPI003083AA65